MSYKKLLSLLAVSSLALVACGENNTAGDPATEEVGTDETAEDAEVDETEDAASEAEDGEDTFDRAAERESGDVVVPVGLEVLGEWTTEGYVVASEGPEATLDLTALPDEGVDTFYLYVTDEDGTILEKSENEEEFAYIVEDVDSEIILYAGSSDEDLGDAGDTVDPEEDFVRYERVIVQPGEAPAEEE